MARAAELLASSEPDGDGCILTFSESGYATNTKHLTGTAAGWQVFLGGLEGVRRGSVSCVERSARLRDQRIHCRVVPQPAKATFLNRLDCLGCA